MIARWTFGLWAAVFASSIAASWGWEPLGLQSLVFTFATSYLACDLRALLARCADKPSVTLVRN